MTADFMNVSSVKGIQMQMYTSKKMQEENLEVAETFASMMNQTWNLNSMPSDDNKSTMEVSETNATPSAADSYERYGYKEKHIDTAKEQGITEQLEENAETLEQAEEDTIAAICEAYDVDEETVKNILDEMGLLPLELLEPQNLVSFLAVLTGSTGEELLLDENFLKVMEVLNNLEKGLLKDLGVDAEGLQKLIAEMGVVDAETVLPKEFQEVLGQEVSVEEIAGQEMSVKETTEPEMSVEKTTGQEITAEETAEQEMSTQEITVEETVEQAKSKLDLDMSEVTENEDLNTGKADLSIEITKQTTDNGTFMEQNPDMTQNSDMNQSVIMNQSAVNGVQMNDVSQMQFSSYFSADSVHIMEQIVQQMRVNVTADVTSMEMQLNPENLGKVYVHISSEEGVVNAQFHATNEVVKEALETQIATLRENLNQAGVKVDAIEVTIASHEFERNLEQNQKNPEEQTAAEEVKTIKRRNITMDSLDDLSGVMTEEETLVAQIMKDNGNSVDLTA